MREKNRQKTTRYPRYALPAAEVISLDNTNTTTSNSHLELDIDLRRSVVAGTVVLEADQRGINFFIKNLYKQREIYIKFFLKYRCFCHILFSQGRSCTSSKRQHRINILQASSECFH
jgi:hypothetical protein